VAGRVRPIFHCADLCSPAWKALRRPCFCGSAGRGLAAEREGPARLTPEAVQGLPDSSARAVGGIDLKMDRFIDGWAGPRTIAWRRRTAFKDQLSSYSPQVSRPKDKRAGLWQRSARSAKRGATAKPPDAKAARAFFEVRNFRAGGADFFFF